MTTITDVNTDTRDSLPVKVMLWTIHGETSKGYTSFHQEVVTLVVSEIDLDVLLLQETVQSKIS